MSKSDQFCAGESRKTTSMMCSCNGLLVAAIILLDLFCFRCRAHGDHGLPHMFENNCASRGLCNRPIEERNKSIHDLPEDGYAIPKGHLKPVGHPDFRETWSGQVRTLKDLDMATFWSAYFPKKPFLLEGFAKRSPAFEKWTDDYLLDRIGALKVRCIGKNDDRLKQHCRRTMVGHSLVWCSREAIAFPESFMTGSSFMVRSRNASFRQQIVTQMPDVLRSEVIAPTFHSCARRDSADPGPSGGQRWTTEILDLQLMLSYNSGNEFATSVLTYEVFHQVVCLFDGRQEWILWDLSRDHSRIPMWRSRYDRHSHSASVADDSPIDAERVDLFLFPGMAEAKWTNVTVEAGDCVFIPALMARYVRSWDRTVAVTAQFSQDTRFDPECGGEVPGTPQPLSAYEVLWSYPEEDRTLLAWDLVKIGFPSWKRHLRALAMKARRRNEELPKNEFISYVKLLAKEAGGLHRVQKRAANVFASMDSDDSGGVSSKELFGSKELRFLLKDICVIEAGNPRQASEDARQNESTQDNHRDRAEL